MLHFQYCCYMQPFLNFNVKPTIIGLVRQSAWQKPNKKGLSTLLSILGPMFVSSPGKCNKKGEGLITHLIITSISGPSSEQMPHNSTGSNAKRGITYDQNKLKVIVNFTLNSSFLNKLKVSIFEVPLAHLTNRC